jgi:flagellar protein FliO/FliZ
VSTVAIIGRMLLALVLVLGVMWALARWARKPMGVGKGERVMTVLARQQLSRGSSVTVLKLMDRALVLGVTEQGVQLLTETELAPIEQVLTVPAQPRRPLALGNVFAARPAPELDGTLSFDDALVSDDGLSSELDGVLESEAVLASVRGGAGRLPARTSKLDGSVLSPNTWKQLLGAARELTVRR